VALQHELTPWLLSFEEIAAALPERIYPVVIPQGMILPAQAAAEFPEQQTPAMAWRIANRSYSEGDLDDVDITAASIEFSVWGQTYALTDEVSEAVRLTLRAWAAQNDAVLTVGDLIIHAATMQRDEDIFDEELLLFGRTQVWDFNGVNL